jgi:hypothetical protein
MRTKGSLAVLVALVFALAPATAAAETVGSDLGALTPTKTIACPGSSCMVAQALGGSGTPFSPPGGIVTSWSVRFGAVVPDAIRLVIQDVSAYGGANTGRRTVDVGAPQGSLVPNRVSTFPERLPIDADQTFGVVIEGSSRARATIAAPFDDEYKTMLLWDPPPPFGGRSVLPSRNFANTRITISADISDPSPGRCDSFNTYTGSKHSDDYGGFDNAGDVIYGRAGNDHLRAYTGDDCVYGGRGRDQIAGMDGNDLLVGGPGADEIGAGQGSDRIRVRDGSRDIVRCAGGRDFVKADNLDVLQGCEKISRG